MYKLHLFLLSRSIDVKPTVLAAKLAGVPFGRMAVSCTSVIWLLMPVMIPSTSVTAQFRIKCRDRGLPEPPSDVDGLTVNLDVECGTTEIKLNITSGVFYVDQVHVFEECMGYNISELASSNVTSDSIHFGNFAIRKDHTERIVTVAPNITNVECSYRGCYIAARDSHTYPHVLPFTAANKCTFTQEIQQAPSSSVQLHVTTYIETPMSTAALTHHTPIQRIISTAAMPSMQQSPMPALQLQATPVTYSNQKLISISQSPYTPTPLTMTMVSGGNGNFLQWVIIVVIFPVALSMLLVFIGVCLILRRADIMRQEKNKFLSPYEDRTEWTKCHNAEEPIDESFFPVLIDLRTKSPSCHSMQTVLDELEYYKPTSSHTTSCTPAIRDPVQLTDAPTVNNNVSSLLDTAQSSDTDCEEHLNLRKEWKSFQTTRQSHAQKVMHLNLSEKFLSQILDPVANVYNYSLDSREYVQVSSLSYSDSGSTTLTTVSRHREDSCVQYLSCDDHAEDNKDLSMVHSKT